MLKRADAPPDYETFGVKYHYLANQQAPGGDYSLYRLDISPQGGGPGPHYHRAMSEAFFVLSGSIKLYDGSDWLDGHQGDFLDVRRKLGFFKGSATRSTNPRRS